MAKEKKEKQSKENQETPVEKKRKKRGGFKVQIFLIFSVITAAVFLPSTVLLFVGMMPTFVAAIADPSRKKAKAVTVGAMNLAGCTPFLLELWRQGHTFAKAVDIITSPTAVVVMYSAAVMGYLIDWAVTGVIAAILYQKGVARQKAIKDRQKELADRWGEEVTGQMVLDEQGFPVEEGILNP